MRENILNGTGHDSFDTERRWADAHIGIMKTIYQSNDNTHKYFIMCIQSALRVEERTCTTPATYLNELGRVAMNHAEGYYQWSMMEDFGDARLREKLSFHSFIDFAVWGDLISYIKACAGSISKDTLSRAAQFPHGRFSSGRVADMIKNYAPTLYKAMKSDRSPLILILRDALGTEKKKAGRTRWKIAKYE
ncbi:hypothetical protein DPSP01_007534 [Paraphaeosphaeria sporulosa]